MKKMKVAIVGFGGMGGWHAKKLADSDVAELAGIYDIDPARCALAEEREIHAYASFEEVLADKSVELVVIATPNDVHEEIAIAAMNAGKNVISEKPVTITLESLERMIAASEKNKVRFSVHQNRRWDQDFLAIKEICQSGELGEVINVESRVHGSRGIPGDWRGMKQYGGGMLYDWGIHLIDQILMIFGFAPKRVSCVCDYITNSECDDGFRLDIYFENNIRATVEVGTYNFINMPRWYLRAKKGTACMNGWKVPIDVIKCDKWQELNVTPVETAAGLTKTMAPRDEFTTDTYQITLPTSDVHDYYRNFVRAIRGEEEQLVTHDQMRMDLKVILAAFESAKTGKVVEL
ncbi:MAG: Gfo/Idh/MocA family oxidoreductase [Ruminococcaceae bacterium]|nr:Gfo/Idh/MocA family oxidoreductase [Oscillospiraceae bacterium]